MSNANDLDILSITDAQLVADLFAAHLDLEYCSEALRNGCTHCGKLSIAAQVERNIELIRALLGEQERRRRLRR